MVHPKLRDIKENGLQPDQNVIAALTVLTGLDSTVGTLKMTMTMMMMMLP